MPDERTCPECGAELEVGATGCWLCGGALASSGSISDQAASRRPQFGIASLLLTITLIAVCLGVLRLAPGVGIGLIVLVTPAFARATVVVARQKRVGQRLGIGQKMLAFLASLGLVVSTALAFGLAFYITCWGGFFLGASASEAFGVTGWDTLGWGLLTGIALGVIGQIVFLVCFIRWLWRRRQEQRNRLGDIGFILSWVAFSVVFGLVCFALSRRGAGLEDAVAGILFLSVPSLIFSLFGVRKAPRLLASCGIGLATAAIGVSSLYLLDDVGVISLDLSKSLPTILLVLTTGVVVAVGGSLLVYRMTRDQK